MIIQCSFLGTVQPTIINKIIHKKVPKQEEVATNSTYLHTEMTKASSDT